MTRLYRTLLAALLVGLLPLSAALAESPTETADAGEALLKHGPQRPSVEQVIHDLDRNHPVRLTMRAEPLRSVGLESILLMLLPDEKKAKYDAFIAETGFDPAAQIEGGVLIADAPDLGELDAATFALFVASIKGPVDDRLIKYLDEYESDDDEDNEPKKKRRTFAFAFLAELSAAQVQVLAADVMAEAAEGNDPATREDFDGEHVLIVGGNKARDEIVCAYFWTGGMMFGALPDPGGDLDEAKARGICTRTLITIDHAAQVKHPSSMPILTAASPIPDGRVDIELTLGTNTSLAANMEVGATMLKKLNEFAKVMPFVKANPDGFLTRLNIPTSLIPLGKLLVANTTFSVKGNIGTLALNVTTSELVKEIQAAVKALKP